MARDATNKHNWLTMFGKTRYGTIKLHCLTYEKILRTSPNTLLWQQDPTALKQYVSSFITDERTPGQLTRAWKTTNWLCTQTGLTPPSDDANVKNHYEHTIDKLIKHIYVTPHKAKTPTMAIIRALEHATVHSHPTDQYAAAVFRFQAGSSSRYNDLQHASPSTMVHTADTIEITPWQTKSMHILDQNKRTPLICPRHTFTGVPWWEPLTKGAAHLRTQPGFEDMDYLLPAPGKHRTTLLPRPATYPQALAWCRTLLSMNGTTPQLVAAFSLHSLRVWLPDLAYRLNLPRDLRRYLGRWAQENTADTYTRDHRTALTNIWNKVTHAITHDEEFIDSVAIDRPTDLDDPTWETNDWELVQQQHDEEPHDVTTTDIMHTPCDEWPSDKGGPLTMAINKTPTGKQRTRKLHYLTIDDQKCIGCSYRPNLDHVTTLTHYDDWLREYTHSSTVTCLFAAKLTTPPAQWLADANHDTNVQHSDTDHSDAATSDTTEDTASDAAELP